MPVRLLLPAMVVQRKNLLEAFRDAGKVPTREPEPPAGPFALGDAPASAKPTKALRAPALPVWLPWSVGLVVVFALGFVLGRRGAPVAASTGAARALEAAKESATRVPQVRYEPPRTPVAERGQETPAAGGGLADPAPLHDPANRYTIIAATYGASRQDLAWATHDLLRDAGLPVWPVAAHGERFLVLVGAAPQSKDLETTLRSLTGLRSWDDTLAYADAYVERIDRLIER